MLSKERIAELKMYFTRCVQSRSLSTVVHLAECGLDLIEMVEVLQQENERLRAEVQKLAKALNEGRLVEVVRCKDCKHINTVYLKSHGIGICDLGECARYGCKPNDYCNYGEAAENGERDNLEVAVNPITIGKDVFWEVLVKVLGGKDNGKTQYMKEI